MVGVVIAAGPDAVFLGLGIKKLNLSQPRENIKIKSIAPKTNILNLAIYNPPLIKNPGSNFSTALDILKNPKKCPCIKLP
jgi:hypothetical protein